MLLHWKSLYGYGLGGFRSVGSAMSRLKCVHGATCVGRAMSSHARWLFDYKQHRLEGMGGLNVLTQLLHLELAACDSVQALQTTRYIDRSEDGGPKRRRIGHHQRARFYRSEVSVGQEARIFVLPNNSLLPFY